MSFLKQKNAVYSVSFSEATDEKPPPSPPPPFSDGSIALTNSSGTIGTFNRPRVRSDAKGGTIIEGENPHADGYFDAQGRYIRSHGLHWIITGLFVVGDLAGGGLVALPTAMIQSGFYYGMVGILVMCFVAGYTSYALGVSWMILLRRWPEYRSHTRKPYPELAYRACGARVKFITSASILVTQFGVSVVYLLLSAKNIRDFVETFFHKSFSYCYVIMIVALVLTPVMFLKSPADFWAAVVLAMFTTSAAVMLIIIGASMDHEACAPHKDMPDFHPVNYFLALGTLIFSFGGHAAFPTIQHDMRRPAEFTKSTVLAFIVTGIMYLPVCAIAYATYGDSLRDSIINSLQVEWIQRTVNLLITIHCILTLTIVINPIMQESEEFFKVPQEFGRKRVIVRCSMLFLVVFVAESIPTFGPLLDLVGGSTLTMTRHSFLLSFNQFNRIDCSIIFPCIFYLYLDAIDRKTREKGDIGEAEPVTFKEVIRGTDRVTLGICCFIIVVGTVGGAAATFSAINGLSTTHFVPPCYLQPFLHHADDAAASTSSINCCGHFQNVTAREGIVCSTADMKFYG
ncbi:Transmembrane amino acid transporter protein [Aphelenchoides fujianensis]|nr:Transmembrane amino acid transporter protein [Aphelenchoides fujianensis]